MKVKFYCDSGANIYSRREATLDTVTELGLKEGEWETLDEDARFELVKEWANDYLELGWEE